ncbi:MAG TPA: hypothetical protein VMZ33_06595 [Candidatus Limnocylindrales bacterium]|nr:hypothetical protein [Candidatus Limnocylindrales bacterium]
MTVLSGARPFPVGARVLPRAESGSRQAARPHTTARRRVSSPARAGRRAQPFGGLIAIVLVALVIGLIYLAQMVRLAQISYEIDTLGSTRDDLSRQVQTLETSVLRYGTESMVLERAQQIGLGQLETRVRLPAR